MPEEPIKKVFVSYRRTEPDQSVAKFLVETLEASGHGVFWDNRITVGQKWARVIDERIRDANFFVVLISAESMRSDMVREEIKLAYELSRRPEAPLIILPIRAAYLGDLPYDLAAYLSPIQYVVWRDESDSPAIAKQIVEAIRSSQQLPEAADAAASRAGLRSLFDATEKKGAPLPKAELRFETGTVKLDSPFYVVRAEDDRVLRSVLGEGTTTVIKGTRQIGKSSLLARSIAAAKHAGLKAFYLDFQTLETGHLKDLNCLFKFLSRRVAKEFRIPEHPGGFWNDDDGPKIGISEFLKRDILTAAGPRTVFLFDEVDRVFEHPDYRDDFFGTLRFWHNERANDSETWDRLNLVIAHSTEPSLWIQDIHQSPFNVGDRVRLRDFQPAQIADLNQRYGSPLKNDAEISQLIRLVGGHPYLVRQAFYSMVSYGWSLPELDSHASESDGPFGDHLKRYTWGLSKDSGLKSALNSILQTGSCDDESHFQRLFAVGLIEGADRQSARLRSQVYEKYFRRHL